MSYVIWGRLKVELLLFLIKGNQLENFEYLIRTTRDSFGFPTMFTRTGPRTCCKDYISLVALECIGIPKHELEIATGEKRCLGFPTLSFLLHDPILDKWKEIHDGGLVLFLFTVATCLLRRTGQVECNLIWISSYITVMYETALNLQLWISIGSICLLKYRKPVSVNYFSFFLWMWEHEK